MKNQTINFVKHQVLKNIILKQVRIKQLDEKFCQASGIKKYYIKRKKMIKLFAKLQVYKNII